MKKLLAVTAALLLTISVNAKAGEPCKAVLCLGGMLTGDSGGSECNSSIREYFDIQVWKKGKFKSSSTKKKRDKFLNQCTAEDGGYKEKISRKWGKTLGM